MSKTESILRQLTQERVKSEIEAIQKIRLPSKLQESVKEYMKVGGRSPFIWKWSYAFLKKHTLPIVPKKHKKQVLIAKFLSAVINVLLDDLVDKQKNKDLLEIALRTCTSQLVSQKNLPGDSLKKPRQEYIRVIEKLCFSLTQIIQKLPRYKEFQEILLFDYQQYFNCLRYGHLTNKNGYLVNILENQIYFSHNTKIMISCTIDLMVAHNLDMNELGLYREIMWKAQRMGRIGNSLTTWKREIFENDYSSEVLSYALSRGIITHKDIMEAERQELIRKIELANIQEYFLKEWEKYYWEIEAIGKRMKSLNIEELLKGLENLLIMHLCSIGYK